jgi:hypothetical protein
MTTPTKLETARAANWTADPRVRPIMTSIRRNPPAVKLYVHGLYSNWNNGLVADQREYDRADERVIALSRIANEYFTALDQIEAEQGTNAYMAAARHWLTTNPSVADAIGYALAERIVA